MKTKSSKHTILETQCIASIPQAYCESINPKNPDSDISSMHLKINLRNLLICVICCLHASHGACQAKDWSVDSDIKRNIFTPF